MESNITIDWCSEAREVMQKCRYGGAIVVRGEETFIVQEIQDLHAGDVVAAVIGFLEDLDPEVFDGVPEEHRYHFHNAFYNEFGCNVGDKVED